MEYRLERSEVVHDIVQAKSSKACRKSRSRAKTPIIDVAPASHGPTHIDFHRLAQGEPLELILAGRYRIEELLGHGGMGAVYRAEHVALRRTVAVKVLDVHQDDWRWAIARFMHEAQLAARVRHRNIVEIYDFGTTPEGVVYIVMEYLVGRDLEAIVRHRRLDWRWTRYLLQQVCAGIGAIHDLGVVHRDLKASNCFFVERGSLIKVLDFGIATTERPEHGEGSIRAVVGTPEYMAPEQIRGQSVDRRADVYSAGVLLCKLLTGRTPFCGYSAEEVFDHQLYSDPPRLRDIADDIEVPPRLDDVVARALAKDPRRRYSTMRELSDALDLAEETSTLRRLLGIPRARRHTHPGDPDFTRDAPLPKEQGS